jgi:hypothetical protein
MYVVVEPLKFKCKLIFFEILSVTDLDQSKTVEFLRHKLSDSD